MGGLEARRARTGPAATGPAATGSAAAVPGPDPRRRSRAEQLPGRRGRRSESFPRRLRAIGCKCRPHLLRVHSSTPWLAQNRQEFCGNVGATSLRSRPDSCNVAAPPGRGGGHRRGLLILFRHGAITKEHCIAGQSSPDLFLPSGWNFVSSEHEECTKLTISIVIKVIHQIDK